MLRWKSFSIVQSCVGNIVVSIPCPSFYGRGRFKTLVQYDVYFHDAIIANFFSASFLSKKVFHTRISTLLD